MRVVRSARLHLREGTSDKVYEVDLVENDGLAAPERFLVGVRYGRRGATLREGTKTPKPLASAAAERVFDSVVVAKLNGGYQSSDRPDPGAGARPDAPEGRDGVLLARLAACRRQGWDERERERLLWRIGQLRIARAAPDLIALARDLGPAGASYALVWALARAGGPKAVPALEAAAAGTPSPVVRDLARFALAGSPPGARPPAQEPELEPDLPPALAWAAEAGDGDGLWGALDALARHEPVRVGPALVALGRRARGEAGLHATLCALLMRLPARPPYLIGLRRLLKHAEMADDAALFGAVAHRFETARAMYRAAGRSHAYVAEFGRYVALAELRGRPDARVGLSSATLAYLRRRIWRVLRKRGEAGDPAFAEMAAGLLLALRPEDLAPRTAWTAWARRPDGTWGRQPRAQGPLGRLWAASQLLHRHTPGAMPRPWSLSFLESAEPDPDHRGEAFPALWSARPDLALRLAAESAVEPVAGLGLRVLRADPAARAAWTPAELGRLLAAPTGPAQRLGFETARDRLARGAADPALLAVLIGAGLADARGLALARIEADPALPWSSPDLAFAVLTSPSPEVGAVLSGLAGRDMPERAAAALAERLALWLRAMPANPDEGARAAIRAMRAGLAALWPARDAPLPASEAAALIAHPAPMVVAAGLDWLVRSGAGVESLPPDLWDGLIGSGSDEVRAAALGLLAGCDDAGLALRSVQVLAFAAGSSPALRAAARPLVVRLAAADPGLAERLARELIGSLFRTAPDEAYAADTVALLAQAMPAALAALDPGTLWRLLQARAAGAQRLGAMVLAERAPAIFSVRQIARLGGHPHLSVRLWAMAAFEAEPARFQAQAEDAVLLVESEWPETLAFARAQFESWPDEAWTPAALSVVSDSVNPDVLAYARHLLRSRLRPGEEAAQLVRLLEHPSPSMHGLVTELLSEAALQDEAAFAKVIPLARIVMLQVLRGRVAKDRMSAFLRGEALRSRARAEQVLPLLSDLTLSGTARDRTMAILALRDVAQAHPGLAVGLTRCEPEARAGARARVGARS